MPLKLKPNTASAADIARPLSVTVLGVGLVVCVLVFYGPAGFGFERFSVPKEFVLALSAMSALVLFFSDGRPFKTDRTLLMLSGVLALGSLTAWHGIMSAGYAVRALTALISGVVIFSLSLALALEGHGPRLLRWVALASVLAALGALGEALHLLPAISMSGRGPGGTAGNRNFLAHFLVIAAVPLVVTFFTAQRRLARAAWGVGLACVVAMIVVSRSRGAWLTSAIALSGSAVALVANRDALSRDARRRLVTAGVPILLALPFGILIVGRGLNWSLADFHASLAHLVDYKTGTGHGRLVQYQATLAMLRDHPVGVGAGQWAISYPLYAGPDDPYYPPNSPVPMDRLPSSDWLGFASQYGIVLLLVVVGCGMTLARRAVHRGRLRDPSALALAAALVVQFVLGIFDAVLFRADTGYAAAVTLGTLAALCADDVLVLRAPRLPAVALSLALSVTLVALSGRRLVAAFIRSDGRLPSLEKAFVLDRSNFILATQIAQIHSLFGRCEEAKPFARLALDACPTASLPKKILFACPSVRASLPTK